MQNKLTSLLGIKYPIIQAGMVWNSGWRLASACSNAGALGILGAGSMYPEVLREHIIKCKKATSNPFGINIPIMYPDMDKIIEVLIEEKVKIVITSAGSPAKYTSFLQTKGIIVIHVVSSLKFALKAQSAGVNAIVAEGFEAGGHNGREELTTATLISTLRDHITIPLVAAGGIVNGKGMFSVMSLGADGVQIGSRFVVSEESSAHQTFKDYVLKAKENDTVLTLKELAPVRMMKNKFYDGLLDLYKKGTTPEELRTYLGRGRTKVGMFEGDLEEGELEIGQAVGLLDKVQPAQKIIDEILNDFNYLKLNVSKLNQFQF